MSKESYFIGCAEVAELVGCGKSRAYKYIQQMVRARNWLAHLASGSASSSGEKTNLLALFNRSME